MKNRLLLLLVLKSLLILNISCSTSRNLAKDDKQTQSTNKHFEGKILYDLNYVDKTGQMSKGQVKSYIGREQLYTIKGNKYKSEMNGLMEFTSYYLGKDTLYNYIAGMDSLTWVDVTKNQNDLINYEIEEQVEKVNGIMCDKLTIISKEGKIEYYYNTNYSVNPNDYSKHEYGFWKFCIEKTKSLPLKNISDLKDAKIEIVMKDIIPTEIEEIEFILPNLPRVVGSAK